MTLRTTPFEGYECVRLESERSTLITTVSIGPRIIGLFGAGSNIMAVLPDATLERPGGPPFSLVGGHRLWAAPELPELTYEPDERPCTATSVDGGLRVEAPADGAGLVKALQVRSAGAGWIVDHELRNEGDRPIVLAPWAITQLRPGGRAELPLGRRGPGPQADRSLVLWPYTDLDDPRLHLERDVIRVDAVPGAGPLKVGAAPGEGRLVYRLDGEVFEKRTAVDDAGPHADRGAAAQVYVRDDFCELETLGPLTELRPGDSAFHRETWTIGEDAR